MQGRKRDGSRPVYGEGIRSLLFNDSQSSNDFNFKMPQKRTNVVQEAHNAREHACCLPPTLTDLR